MYMSYTIINYRELLEEEINLTHDELNNLEGTFAELAQIVDSRLDTGIDIIHLNLSSTNLQELPDNISSLTNLQKLNLSNNNNLRIFPDVIRYLSNIRVLDIGNTNITTLPDIFGDLNNLRLLRIPNIIMENGLPGSIYEIGGRLRIVFDGTTNIQRNTQFNNNNIFNNQLNNQLNQRNNQMNNQLNNQLYKNLNNKNKQNILKFRNNKECSICLNGLNNNNKNNDKSVVYLDKCKHKFHKKCIKKWSRRVKKCPICRTDFDKYYKIKDIPKNNNRAENTSGGRKKKTINKRIKKCRKTCKKNRK